MLIANKIFQVTVLFIIYFCNQFVAPEIGNSSQQTPLQCVNNQRGIQQRRQDFDNFICSQYGGKIHYFKHRKYQNL